jgi:branched-subunit amino acid transport protein
MQLPMRAFFSRPDFIAGKALRLVPAAMLAAIVAPAVMLRELGSADSTLAYAKLIAGLVAAVVAWRTRSPTVTMIVGMGALWLSQWALRAAA